MQYLINEVSNIWMKLKIPVAWVNLLEDIQKTTPMAVIAGGCLRDLYNGAPIKDIDIFIYSKGERHSRELIEALLEAGFKLKLDERKEYPQDLNLEVNLVCELENLVGSYPVQLIFVNWPIENIMDRFDYGICQIMYDGRDVRYGEYFFEDMHNKVFHLRRERKNGTEERASVMRYVRLLEKYPGWDWYSFHEENIEVVFGS